jgi:hypothetical protein
MKSILKRALVFAAVIGLAFPGLAFASDQVQSSPQAQTTTIKFTPSDYSYKVNGTKTDMDVPALIMNDRVYVPVRYLANSLGIKDDHITYDEDTRHVKLIGSKIIELTLDDTRAVVDGQQKILDTPPVSRLTRAYLPARFICEELGWKVVWDAPSYTVIISKDAAVEKKAFKPKPAPAKVSGPKYFELQNIEVISGIFREQLLFVTPAAILLHEAPYKAIILADGSKTVYLVKNNSTRLKYQLSSPVTRKDGKWLISDEQDVSLMKKLGSFLKTD